MSITAAVIVGALCALAVGIAIGVLLACTVGRDSDEQTDAQISQLYRDKSRQAQWFTTISGRCTCGALDDWAERGIGTTAQPASIAAGPAIISDIPDHDWLCAMPECERRVWASARGGRKA